MKRALSTLGLVAALAAASVASEPDSAEYRTLDKAIAAKVAKTATSTDARPGFLGVYVTPGAHGATIVSDVASVSPAARAGVRKGDVIWQFDGVDLNDTEAFSDRLRSKSVGDAIKLGMLRGDQRIDVTATLDSASRPMSPGKQKAVLGVKTAVVKDGEGVAIEQVDAGSAAERAKLKVGEVILKIDDVDVASPTKLADAVAAKSPDEPVTLTMLVAEKTVELKLRLGAERASAEQPGERRPQGFNRGMTPWTKPTFRLGIICVEYPDVKHNAKITPEAWHDSMFSHGTYTKTSITGQTVHGSMYDYYLEQSLGALKIDGRAFEYVEVSKKRSEYATGDKSVLLKEALDKLIERDKDALNDLDGVFFIYAGDRYQAARGSLYWPHRSNVNHNGKRWPYFICPEGGARMTSTSVFCHEFGHMLGLPDLYARPENPGMEGAGVWSAMANQVGNGKPQHFDVWSKEKLGWVKPVVIDPTVKQKLILGPIEDSATECIKIPVRPDGSEYLLLENRRKKGFDASLPAEGLLIWRVVGRNNPMLEESHGVAGAAGPRSYLDRVPYPSSANDAFTPFTTPSSRSQLGGGGATPVYLTNITRLPDGRISFHIGYQYH